MFFETLQSASYVGYKERRDNLIEKIKEAYPQVKDGVVLLFAGFEKPDVLFRQESSFYYFTGIKDPGVALMIDMQKKSVLYVPNCFEERARWACSSLQPTDERAKSLNLEKIELLGKSIKGYNIFPYFDKSEYENVISVLASHVKGGGNLFVLNPNNSYQYVEQRFVLDRLKLFVPEIKGENLFDISAVVSQMRRAKNIFDIGKISDAINITLLAQEAAANAIKDRALEFEVQAAAEYVFTASGASRAFPTIVASGKNATILHYTDNDDQVDDGELVLVDLGADLDHYCGDITRTYPASGNFTDRQKELYNIVLETQKYIASIAKPGYFLVNKDEPEKSLQHLAKAFLKEKGYDQYFVHGIGHYLGLDVHDVGFLKDPLQDGDVITIEPGIYIPDENLGIRIEDNYWVTKQQTICLSEMFPKELEDIEELMKTGSALIEK